MATGGDQHISAQLDGELPEKFRDYRKQHDYNKTEATRELLRHGLKHQNSPETATDGGREPSFTARILEWCARVSLLFAVVTGLYGVMLNEKLLVETTGFAIGTIIFGLAYMAEHGWTDVELAFLDRYHNRRDASE